MKTDIITLCICLTISTIINIILFFLYTRLWNSLVEDYKDEKHYCNYCKRGYIESKKERAKTTCDYCKRPLTLHMEHPKFQEEAVERKNHLEPFEEFNNKDED